MTYQSIDRRSFLKFSGASLAAASCAGVWGTALAEETKEKHYSLKKAVKYGMIKAPGSIEDKLNLVKGLGFEGVEMNSPSNIDFAEAAKASAKTGVKIHGIIDSIHWETRFSDPDPAVRAKAVEALKQALRDAKTVGADTVLVVPAKVSKEGSDNEDFDQCWQRSHEEISKAIPLANELGVKIAIEVVWNDFITSPEMFVKYIDEFNSPAVGGYFDCSNMVKYGVPPAEWIRKLGKRMLKFDFKGYSKSKGWVAIGEGDEDWPEILKALDEVQYHGWATSEVSGGGAEHLKDVAARMNKCLGL